MCYGLSTVLGRLVIVSLLALAAPAAAQEDRARQLFESGVAALDGGDPAGAARFFDESFAIAPRASTACNMAVAQERLAQHCEARRWYEQCAAIDQSGRFRDHAREQANVLASSCTAPQPLAPQQPPQQTYALPPSQVQVIESSQLQTAPIQLPPRVQDVRPAPDHTLLGVGIAGAVLGAGALVGGIFAGQASWDEYEQISAPPGTALVEGTPDADHYDQAALFSDVAVGLYVGGGVLAGLGVVLIIVDLAQPGVFGGPSVAIGPGHASLRGSF